MVSIVIEGKIAQRLQEMAEKEERSVEDVLETLMEDYTEKEETEASVDGFLAMDGMFDDEVGNLSETVRETMQEYYRKKYGDSA